MSFEFQRRFFIIYNFVCVKNLLKLLLFHIICIFVPSETKHCETNYNGLMFRAYFLIVIKRYDTFIDVVFFLIPTDYRMCVFTNII